MTQSNIKQQIISNVGAAADFDFEIIATEEASVTLRVAYRDNMTRLGGTISGPVIMTAADTAMYAAVIHAVDDGGFAVTSHMNIEFLRRPPPADLELVARVLRAGRRQISMTVEVTSVADDRPVAFVTGAYARFDAATKAATEVPPAAGSESATR